MEFDLGLNPAPGTVTEESGGEFDEFVAAAQPLCIATFAPKTPTAPTAKAMANEGLPMEPPRLPMTPIPEL